MLMMHLYLAHSPHDDVLAKVHHFAVDFGQT